MGLRRSGASLLRSITLPNLKRKTLGSFSSVYDTYLSTKEVFEKHRVVFTVATSLGSLATAWAGYSLRYYHQNKVEHRLDSIEESMKSRSHIDHDEIKKIVSSGTVSLPACIATAGTTMIIGYGLGWRGGRWLLNRKFRREQLKALQQAKPKRWQFLRRPWLRPWGRNRNAETPPHKVVETRGTSLKSEL